MKKILVVTIVIGSFLLGGTVTYAVTNYYADLLSGQQENMEEEIEEEYRKQFEEVGSVQHNDMVMLVETKRLEILEEISKYADEKIKNDASVRKEEHSKAIELEADRILEELKLFIDEL